MCRESYENITKEPRKNLRGSFALILFLFSIANLLHEWRSMRRLYVNLAKMIKFIRNKIVEATRMG
jgi:hypothetical protein